MIRPPGPLRKCQVGGLNRLVTRGCWKEGRLDRLESPGCSRVSRIEKANRNGERDFLAGRALPSALQYGTSNVHRTVKRSNRDFPHGLFLAGAKGISKESGDPPLELPPKGWSPVEDGTAAVITKDLFHARDPGGIFLVFDAINPLIATITIERRFHLRGQHFHFEFNLRTSRPSKFGSPSLRPK